MCDEDQEYQQLYQEDCHHHPVSDTMVEEEMEAESTVSSALSPVIVGKGEGENSIKKYSEFLDLLRLVFNDFLRFAEQGKTIRHASLKARKISITIRDLMKQYRVIALENDKRITKIYMEAKKQIKQG